MNNFLKLSAIFGVVFIVLISALMFNFGTNGPSDFQNESGFYLVGSDDARVQSAEFKIGERLISPATENFSMAEIKTNDTASFIRIDVDSQSEYGGLVRSEWGVKMHWSTFDITNGYWSLDYCDKLSGPSSILK